LLINAADDGQQTEALKAVCTRTKSSEVSMKGDVRANEVEALDTAGPPENTLDNGGQAIRPRSLKHRDLLEKQQLLEKQNNACKERLAQLKKGTGRGGSLESVPKPQWHRQHANAPMVQPLSDLNASLTSENKRLYAELARLVSCVRQLSKET